MSDGFKFLVGVIGGGIVLWSTYKLGWTNGALAVTKAVVENGQRKETEENE